MSYHFYDNHPANSREIAVMVDDDMIYAKYEDDDDVFFVANSEDENLRDAVVSEFGEDFAKRLFLD